MDSMMPSFDNIDKESRGGPLRSGDSSSTTEEKKVEEKEGNAP
jgi:hypothetical protein